MNRCFLVLSLLVLTVGGIYSFRHHGQSASAAAVHAVKSQDAQPARASELMIERRFNVTPGGDLNVEVADADIQVRTSASQEARVEVVLEARNMERARRYFEQLNFQVEQRGNTVVVTHDKFEGRWPSSEETDYAHVTVTASIPQQFDAEVATSDGDVSVGSLQGRLTAHSSDGDISAGDVNGPAVTLRTSDGNIDAGALEADEISLQTSDGNVTVRSAIAGTVVLRTSDGNIAADRLQGATEIVTSDGDIRLGNVMGANVVVRTSDGDIQAEALTAEGAEVVTSDGNIRLYRVDAPLSASTSSGNVNVSLLKPAEVRLRSTDGNILLSTPRNLPADVRLRGDDVRLSSAYAFTGTVLEKQAEGRINGGGPLLDASTSDGVVSIEVE